MTHPTQTHGKGEYSSIHYTYAITEAYLDQPIVRDVFILISMCLSDIHPSANISINPSTYIVPVTQVSTPFKSSIYLL